jgi:hypothetical protein
MGGASPQEGAVPDDASIINGVVAAASAVAATLLSLLLILPELSAVPATAVDLRLWTGFSLPRGDNSRSQ